MSGHLQVVLGAGGGIGSALVQELAARGQRVRAVNRNGDAEVPDGVERMAADISTTAGATAAAAGADVVYHAAQPAYSRWAQDFPAMNAAVIDGVAAAGAKLVFADNLYMYGPITGPISEASPQRPSSRKGAIRARLADQVLQAHATGRLRAAIGRASDYYGPRGTGSLAGDTVFAAVLAGKKVQWPADADQPHTFAYLPDIARALITLAERPEADGQAWILPAAEPLTGREFIELAVAAAGTSARTTVVSKPMMRLAGLFIPPARQLPDIWYQYAAPFTTDADRFQIIFGAAEPTAHRQAVTATANWFRTRAHG